MASALYNSLQFLASFGFFDVILPFLLVFTVVFGILEKTRIFGKEGSGDDAKPRKNINSMVAFSIAFFVIAATRVVEVMQVILPQMIIVLIIIIAFMILFGSMMKEGEANLWSGDNDRIRNTFIFGIFVAMIAIVLGAFGMLGDVINYVARHAGGTLVSSVVLLIIVVGAIWFVMNGKSE